MKISFVIGNPCAGGNHVPILATTETGKSVSFVYDKNEMFGAFKGEVEATLSLLLRFIVKNSTATTLSQAKTLIESKEWEI